MPLFQDPDSPTPDEMQYMGAVDAAWQDKGQIKHYWASLVLCSFFFAFIIWAALANIDEVTRGDGQVVPSQRVQLIQHLEGGILREIVIQEGTTVDAGTILARVDNVGAASQMRDTQTRIFEHSAAIARLEAEMEGREPVFSEQIQAEAPMLVQAELVAFNARILQQKQEQDIMQSQIEQRKQESEELGNRRATFTEALALAQRRGELARPLVQKKLYPEVDYLNLQQEIVRLQGEINAIASTISKAESAITEVEQRKKLTSAELHSTQLKELGQHKSELASLEELLTTGADRVTRTELRAPVRGIVNRVLLSTVGSVVKPGDTIMELVPLDGTLVVEAKIRPSDIAFIRPGQKAVVKITAYDPSIYGSLNASVEQISADTFTNQPTNEVYYQVKVRTSENGIHYRGEDLPITPGMVASVDILTGKKTILDYLLKPIIKARDSALRER